MKSFKIALCQIKPEYNKQRSVEIALDMVKTASDGGAALAVLPEMFYHPYEILAIAKGIGEEQQYLDRFCHYAALYNMYICTGTMAVRENEKVYNRSYLIDRHGKVILSYDKCHLFDASFKQLRARESLVFSPGSGVTVIDTDLGKIGIVICYDIRFPELVRSLALQGAEILLVPAVFNTITGPAHWHITMRTRAVENQIFLAAVSQARIPESSYQAYGHSMAITPWGEILTEASDNHEILFADFDPVILEETRERLPLLKHRREDLYQMIKH